MSDAQKKRDKNKGEPAEPAEAPVLAAPVPLAMPLERAVPWMPVAEGMIAPETVPWPLFIAQRVIIALQETDSAIGFLVGRRAVTPDTGTPFLLIEDVVTMPQPFFGDRPMPVITRQIARVREEQQKDGREILGWHHTHGVHGLMLTLADVETHRQHFPEAWQVALIAASQEGLSAASLFRPQGPDTIHTIAPLPFFELRELNPPPGAPRTFMTWAGYRSTDASVPQPQPRPSKSAPVLQIAAENVRPSGNMQVLPPPKPARDEDDPAWRTYRSWPTIPKWAWYPLMAVLGAGLVIGFNALQPKGPAAPVRLPAAVAAPQDSLAVAATALERSVASYLEKQSLFEQRMMVCADLGTALVEFEEKLVAFSVLQGAAGPAAAQRYAPLVARADSIDLHFTRSRCARP